MIKSVIVVFDGSNRQDDLAAAIFSATDRAAIFLSARENILPDRTDIVFLPGGFSYGDYLRSGAMAAKTPMMAAVKKFAAAGGRVLGICNGFQILCEAGMLSGWLVQNREGKFICQWQGLIPQASFQKLFGGDYIYFPIAHGDGNFRADPDTIKKLHDGEQVLFCYDQNPNGSMDNIAGICNHKKNIFGMMPHPENNIADFHHNRFSQQGLSSSFSITSADGLVFFKNFFALVF
ncbi:MAG: phosphoribosylformylglycinamidine synthase subunit PurQ [Alphaproteobacteria bacterium]